MNGETCSRFSVKTDQVVDNMKAYLVVKKSGEGVTVARRKCLRLQIYAHAHQTKHFGSSRWQEGSR